MVHITGALNNVKNIVILANLNTNLEWAIEDQIVTWMKYMTDFFVYQIQMDRTFLAS